MSEETLKWLSGLQPGSISAYAILVLIIVVGIWAIHTDNVAFGPRWRDKVEECKTCNKKVEELTAALTEANKSLKEQEREENRRIIEIERLRMQMEFHQWRMPSQPGTTQ